VSRIAELLARSPVLRGVDPRALGEHRASALQRLLETLARRAEKEARRPPRV